MNVRLNQIMTQEIETIEPEALLREAAEKMKHRSVGALPVVQGRKLVGVITDRDIALTLASPVDASKSRVRDVMTPDPYCVYEGQTLPEACQVMEERGIRRLLVLNPEGRLSGVLSLDDVFVRGHAGQRPAEVLRRIGAVA